VKGHAGHPENERADRLASDAAVEAGRRPPA
jgi:ribonuclease HI